MNKNVKGGLVYYTFESLEQTGLVRHGFSTRLGGASTGCYSSLNLGLTRGDSTESVLKNYETFLGALGIEKSKLVLSAQTHTTNVMRVNKTHRGNGFTRDNEFKDVDGLVTNEPETALVTFYADCVPIFFLDPVKKAISLAHAGWKGTLNKIAGAAVRLMETEFGSKPGDILAGIGPSIGPCCFETDEPVWSLFIKKGFEAFITQKGESKAYIDLWQVNRHILMESGVANENIETAGICTKCASEIFYSHRAMGENRGSLAAIMELI